MFNLTKQKTTIFYLKLLKHPLQGRQLRKVTNLPNMEITLPKNFYFLGMVAIFKGEDDYLVEWIEFHKLMGVEHFILYDNGLRGSSRKILEPYIRSGLVTHILLPHIEGSRDGRYIHTVSTQQVAYADAIIRFKDNFHYLLQLDLDEFLFPKSHNSISEILKTHDKRKLARIEVNWTNFGSNGHVDKPTGLVIENFTKSGRNTTPKTVKSISNTKYLSRFFIYTNVHRFSHRLSIKDMITKLFFGYPIIVKGEQANDLFQLNHYITKSKEEFLAKNRKFKQGWQIGKKTPELYDELNNRYSQIDNTSILKFLPQMKSILNKNN